MMQVTLLRFIGVDDVGTVLNMPLRPEKILARDPGRRRRQPLTGEATGSDYVAGTASVTDAGGDPAAAAGRPHQREDPKDRECGGKTEQL